MFHDSTTGAIIGFWCTFDSGWCDGWLNGELSGDEVGTDPFLVNRGATSTPLTGPAFDHTRGDNNGAYIYLEGSDLTRYGEQCVVRSPEIDFGAFDAYCLMFWYSMYGVHVESIAVTIEFRSFNVELDLLTLGGEQTSTDEEWRQASVDIIGGNQPNLEVRGSVKLTARYGKGYKSDIAIDDVLLVPSACTIE